MASVTRRIKRGLVDECVETARMRVRDQRPALPKIKPKPSK